MDDRSSSSCTGQVKHAMVLLVARRLAFKLSIRRLGRTNTQQWLSEIVFCEKSIEGHSPCLTLASITTASTVKSLSSYRPDAPCPQLWGRRRWLIFTRHEVGQAGEHVLSRTETTTPHTALYARQERYLCPT